jgi:hypothetical protein
MKTSLSYAMLLAIVMPGQGIVASAQASVASLAQYQKKQNDGIAEAIRSSQDRTHSGKLEMGASTAKGEKTRPRPAVIRSGVHPRQTGIDNRRGNNMR